MPSTHFSKLLHISSLPALAFRFPPSIPCSLPLPSVPSSCFFSLLRLGLGLDGVLLGGVLRVSLLPFLGNLVSFLGALPVADGGFLPGCLAVGPLFLPTKRTGRSLRIGSLGRPSFSSFLPLSLSFPSLPAYGSWSYVVISACLCIGCFVSLVYSSFLDPGEQKQKRLRK